jgi:enoyl-CoA hydratase/carnithine racemase
MDSDTNRDLVLAERRGAVLLLTLNRPERLNAWNTALENRYFERLDEATADPDVGAVVVTGAGRGFCAGADMDELEEAGSSKDVSGAGVVGRPRPRSYPRTLRKPMIAALNGAAAGLGLVEALYCDLRFATPAAKLTTAFVRRGLIAEYGISWLLPRIVGTGAALDLLLSGRIVLGEEALALGLVNRVCEPEQLVDQALAYAEDLARNCSPTSMAIIKRQVNTHLDVSFEAAFEESHQLLLESFQREDVAEGVNSYLERRPPRFPPLAAER